MHHQVRRVSLNYGCCTWLTDDVGLYNNGSAWLSVGLEMRREGAREERLQALQYGFWGIVQEGYCRQTMSQPSLAEAIAEK